MTWKVVLITHVLDARKQPGHFVYIIEAPSAREAASRAMKETKLSPNVFASITADRVSVFKVFSSA